MNKLFRTVYVFLLVLMLLLLLARAAAARAGYLHRSNESTSNSPPSSIGMTPSEAPVAGDDSGPGFTTDERQVFDTASVLVNDSDADGDPLFVTGIDTTNLLGLLSRLDGGLDTSFDGDGMVTTDIGWLDYATDLAMQPDGKILLAGHYINGNSNDFAVLRYNSDGSLDEGFDGDGIATTDFGWTDEAYAVTRQPDGRIIVAGAVFENNVGLARYNPDGSLDLSFGENGKVTTSGINAKVWVHMGLVLQSDGKIVVAGISYDMMMGYTILAIRFNPDGSLDLTFDEDGIVQTGISNNTLGYDAALQPDGKILVSGFASVYQTGESGFVLIRYNPDGSLDATFDEDGIVLTDMGYVTEGRLGIAMAFQPDGKIIAIGNTNDAFVMARYNPDGSLDPAFGEDGIVQTVLLKGAEIVSQPDGKIVIVGTSGSTGEGYDICAVRFNPDGSLDSTFGDAGMVTLDFEDDRGTALTPGPGGTIIVAGTAGGDIALARFFRDGTFTYDPNERFNDLRYGEQADDIFSYIVSDGVLTDTAAVTITIEGAIDHAYIPLVVFPPRAIYGYVTENDIPMAGIQLELRFYDGADWSTIATTTTDAAGKYVFSNVPGLSPGQSYDVLYSNSSDPNRLWVWGTRELTSYIANTSVNIGNFDIANIQLISPLDEAQVSLPYVFQWQPRPASPSDSYEFNVFDPEDEDPYFWTDPPLGYVGSYALSSMPPGFEADIGYWWEIWVYSPDGGYGISYEARWVAFGSEELNSSLSLQTTGPKASPDREHLRKR